MRAVIDLFKQIYDFIFPPLPFCAYCRERKRSIEDECEMCLETRKRLKAGKSKKGNYACYYYDDIIKDIVWDYKYNRNEFLGEQIAYDIAKMIGEQNLNADYITFVPLHRSKKRKRGFDQAKEICIKLEEFTDVQFVTMLKRIKKTDTQTLLSEKERKNNVKNAFKYIYTGETAGKSVIIIDDVYTTGATMESCKKEMIENGVEKVIPITYAKTFDQKNIKKDSLV